MPSIFKIKFTDGTTFDGGPDLYNSNWMEIPDKSIDCLVYFLSDNEELVLRGFDKYLHFVEVSQNVYGKKGTDFKPKMQYAYLMGIKGNMVTSYRFSLLGTKGVSRYTKGDMTKRVMPLGKEHNGKPTNPNLWKGNK